MRPQPAKDVAELLNRLSAYIAEEYGGTTTFAMEVLMVDALRLVIVDGQNLPDTISRITSIWHSLTQEPFQ